MIKPACKGFGYEKRFKRDMLRVLLYVGEPNKVGDPREAFSRRDERNRATSEIGQEQSMVSHNLKILEQCSFVFSERRGKEKYVSLNGDTVNSIFGIVEEHEDKYCRAAGNCPYRH
jgi:DNA-binding transcriptional ArsR family regulator